MNTTTHEPLNLNSEELTDDIDGGGPRCWTLHAPNCSLRSAAPIIGNFETNCAIG
jgi:hypothetical protein